MHADRGQAFRQLPRPCFGAGFLAAHDACAARISAASVPGAGFPADAFQRERRADHNKPLGHGMILRVCKVIACDTTFA